MPLVPLKSVSQKHPLMIKISLLNHFTKIIYDQPISSQKEQSLAQFG